MHTYRVKIRLYSVNANPNVDSPLLHKSRHYVDGLIETGEAIYLGTGAAQLTVWRASVSPGARQFRAGVGDWFTSDCSALPGEQLLRITTSQLAT